MLSEHGSQVMMEWEKPYMEKSVDFMDPHGDVLEIGFGLGYSATQFMKYPIKSYTIVECDPDVIERIKIWKMAYNIPVHIVQGTWQEKLKILETFDSIYFDDFPLNIHPDSDERDMLISNKRLFIFLDCVIQHHTRIGSKISMYLNNCKYPSLSSTVSPFVETKFKLIDIVIPETCKYRDLSKQQCLIPLLVKTREFDLSYANSIALKQLLKVKNS